MNSPQQIKGKWTWAQTASSRYFAGSDHCCARILQWEILCCTAVYRVTWAFLDRIGSHIQLEPTTWARPQRVGDRFIMDNVVANLPSIKPIELVHIQRVRLFMGVTTLADISSSDGKTFCDWVLPVYENPRKPVFRFPHQERPRASNVIATALATDYTTVLRTR
jgi:hypothetical protein